MPGVKFSDIRVQVKANNVLFMSSKRRRLVEEGVKFIKMERPERNFLRKFVLPENADTDKIAAVSRDGVLTVTAEKVAPPQQPPIEVEEEALSSCKDGCKVDRISMLPDELVVCILSLLSFKEVCCASILCRRWRYLHTLTPKLDFDGTGSLRKMIGPPGYRGDPVVVREKSREYIESVGRAVRLHQSSCLLEFRVVFTLKESHTQCLDEWVRFALSRKVESLDLHLTDREAIPEEGCYAFPYKYLKLVNSNLKKLSTYFVKVSGEAVEMILRNCPLLEQLSIGQSSDLASLKISKPFPSFRMLEILMCWKLKSVVVRDSNITSVRYKGPAVKFELENVGLLREIWVGGLCTYNLEDVVEMFPTQLLPQLHILKLGLWSSQIAKSDSCSNFREAVGMTSLKELVVDIGIIYNDENSLLPLIHLIKASPNLQRFVILAPHTEGQVNKGMSRGIPRVERESPRAYPCLKEVKFVGYRGISSQFEILRHFMENAIALESITIDPWGYSFNLLYNISWDRIPRRIYDAHVFARANALKQCAPFGIHLNIL